MIAYSTLSSPATEQEAAEISRLVKQLLNGKDHAVSIQDIDRTLANGTIIVAWDTEAENLKIVGTASLFFLDTILGKVGFVEHVVVDEAYRRNGIGAHLMKMLFVKARKAGCTVAEWTSGDYRIAAKAFYETLGAKSRQQRKYTKVL